MKLVNRLSNIQMRIGNYKKSKNQELVFYSQPSCNDTTLHFLSKSMHVTKIADIIEYNTFCANSGLLSFPESKKRLERGSVLFLLYVGETLVTSGWSAYQELFWIAENDTVIDMANSKTVVLYDFETVEAFRGRGYYVDLLKFMVADIAVATEFVIYAKKENKSSQRGIEKAGFIQNGIYKQDEPKYLEYLKSKGFLYLGHKYLYGGLKYAGNI